MTDTTTPPLLPTLDEAQAWLARREQGTTLDETAQLLDDAARFITRLAAHRQRETPMSEQGYPIAGYSMPEGFAFTGPMTVTTDADGELLMAHDGRGRVIYQRAFLSISRFTPPKAQWKETPESDGRAERLMRSIEHHIETLPPRPGSED